MDNGKKELKTFVFHVVDAHGHVNCLRGIADTLRNRGHKIIFVCETEFEDVGYPLVGIEERIQKEHERKEQCAIDSNGGNNNCNDNRENKSDIRWANRLNDVPMGMKNAKAQLEHISKTFANVLGDRIDDGHDETLKKILAEIKPDVIISDHGGISPAFMAPDSPYKWVVNYSCNPLQLYRDNFGDKFPSGGLGVSVKANRRELERSWLDYNDSCWKYFAPILERQAQIAGITLKHKSTINPSPYMNIYMCPKCLDYEEEAGGPLPNWFRADSSVRQVAGSFEIPEKLANKSGKLIFVSMGTLASAKLDLMKRIVRVLSRSPHRFIVTKGIHHAEYELADNMWGEKFVKQTLILPKVDAIITHGGNNTITESLHFGVPSIVVTPMFWDQLDNATRIQDKRLGYSLDIVSASDDEILATLEKALNDEEAKKRVKAASREIQAAKGTHKVATLLEMLADGRNIKADV